MDQHSWKQTHPEINNIQHLKIYKIMEKKRKEQDTDSAASATTPVHNTMKSSALRCLYTGIKELQQKITAFKKCPRCHGKAKSKQSQAVFKWTIQENPNCSCAFRIHEAMSTSLRLETCKSKLQQNYFSLGFTNNIFIKSDKK